MMKTASLQKIRTLLLGHIKMTLENKRSVLQKHNGSQKLSQIENPRLFRGKFQHSNFRNKFIIVFHSCVRVVILLCFLSQLKAEEKRIYHNLTEALQNPTDVQILYLNSNQLITFPKEIGKLKSLQKLYLSNNQLTTFPKEIGYLKELELLELDDIPALRSQEKKIRKLLPKVNIIFIEIKE